MALAIGMCLHCPLLLLRHGVHLPLACHPCPKPAHPRPPSPTSHPTPPLQDDMSHFPFKVVAGPGDKPMMEVEFKGETKQFSAEEISSMVLSKMKEVAET